MFWRETTASLIRLFYPHLCYGCGAELFSSGQLLCLSCHCSMPETGFQFHANNPVEKIFWGRLPLVAATSLYYFTKGSALQHLLHQLKYGGKKEAGTLLGTAMGENLIRSNRFQSLDLVVPLPLHPKKEKRRGYNQAAVISKAAAEILKLPMLDHAVERVEETETQTHKGRIERWANIAGKFRVIDPTLKAKHILLVDDVVTTGATLESCGTALLELPGLRLSIATIAYTAS